MQRAFGCGSLTRLPWSNCYKTLCQTDIPCILYCRQRSAIQRAASTLNFQELDRKWQKRWKDRQSLEPDAARGTDYILAMFPYPSGALHMGHVRVYTIADVLARFKRMQGNNSSRQVIYPMGWDAFGLPAENAAIERGLDPAQWTQSNIMKMKEQLQGMNTDIDWSRELVTCSPDFYKHTQRIFLLLHQHGMAYQAESLVNYDPIDQTVLANEQVDSNGLSWRSGAKVQKLNLKQWFFRITDFRDELLEDLKLLTKWPERVIAMQQNWIGKSTGTKLSFELVGETRSTNKVVSVFTTRLDTLFGVQFLAVSSAHPLVVEYAKVDRELAAFLQRIPNLPEGSKVGYRIRGVSARNPLASVPGSHACVHEPLSIWVTPYVKNEYGEGAIMGVPAHDERDFAFWTESCPGQPVRFVVEPSNIEDGVYGATQGVYTDQGQLTSMCGSYAGMLSDQASQRIHQDLESNSIAVQNVETWRLRDWLISRQRYWGTPIPIIHCQSCGSVPVPVQDLPVELPVLPSDTFQGRKGNPLESAKEWLNVSCPKCKQPAKRDTDTMDTFVDSSWYMFRFVDPLNTTLLFSPEKANQHMPVDTYVGGIEHAILHLLYARFLSKFLAKLGMWPEGSSPDLRGEPFRQLISQGMVHGKTFSDPETGRFLRPEEVDTTDISKPTIISSSKTPIITFEKMSKSKYNGVDPSTVISRYGADVTRVHMLFQAPVSEVLEWEEARIVGVQRWLIRLHKHVEDTASVLRETTRNHQDHIETSNKSFDNIDINSLFREHATLYLKTQQTVKSITDSLADTCALNTCISHLMILTNDILASKSTIPVSLLYHVTSNIIKLVGPFAPAFAEEAWEILHGFAGSMTISLFEHGWPEMSDLAELEDWAKGNLKKPCAIMENGKLRIVLDFEPMPENLDEMQKLNWALQQMRMHDSGENWLRKKEAAGGWNRVIVVKDAKAVNFVGAASK